MTVPFMRAYTELLVQTCHRRGAHAIGGMAAFIPTRKDAEVNERALAKVREDKQRESGDGFDGTWVAHPDLVPVAREVFDAVLGDAAEPEGPAARGRPRHGRRAARLPRPGRQDHRARRAPQHQRRRSSTSTPGCAATAPPAINNLMEDAATAEISRAQLWQWVHKGAMLADGRRMSIELFRTLCDEELARLGGRSAGRLGDAADIMATLVESATFTEFLTLVAYDRLD